MWHFSVFLVTCLSSWWPFGIFNIKVQFIFFFKEALCYSITRHYALALHCIYLLYDCISGLKVIKDFIKYFPVWNMWHLSVIVCYHISFVTVLGVSMARWLGPLTLNQLLLTAVGLNPARDLRFFHVKKLVWYVGGST